MFFNPEASVEALRNGSGPAVATVAPYTLGIVPSLSRLTALYLRHGGGPTGSGSVCQVKVKAEEGSCSSNVWGGGGSPNLLENEVGE